MAVSARLANLGDVDGYRMDCLMLSDSADC